MLFSLADLFTKVMSNEWHGEVNFYPSGRTLSQADVHTHTQWLAQNVPACFGDKVIVVATPSIETVVSMLWLWHQGAVVVPVKSDMCSNAIEQIATNCQARFLLHNTQCTKLVDTGPCISRFRECSPRRVTGADLALLIYTSGSTGIPKGIMLTHNNVITAVHSISTYLRLDTNEHIIGLSPLSFDYGLYQLLFCFVNDCKFTLFEDDFHPLKVLSALEKLNITCLPIVPAMGIALVKLIRAFKKQLPYLRKVTNTGGHLGECVIDDFHALIPGIQVFAMYGLTECKRALYLPPEKSQEKRGSVGIPMPGLEAKLFTACEDASGEYFQEVPRGEIGELYVRSATVMQGYYVAPTQADSTGTNTPKTGANLYQGQYRDDNWLATGDLFAQDEDGYFYFKGRSKELIKQAGFCLYPTELEALIEKNEWVKIAGIVPTIDRTRDEVACLFVELHEDNEQTRAAFEAWLKDTIDADYRPRLVKFVAQIQLTPNSKVDKKALKALCDNA